MPPIQARVIEGVFSEAQTQDLIQKLTDAMVDIEDENMGCFTWVVIEEI